MAAADKAGLDRPQDLATTYVEYQISRPCAAMRDGAVPS
jgi:hypothetical protein